MTAVLASRTKYADPGLQADGQPRYPIDTPEHVRAAVAAIERSENAERYTPQQLRRVKIRIRSAVRRLEAPPAQSTRSRLAARLSGLHVTRSGPLTYSRSYALDDIQISRSGDGRTVEAYAAIFDAPYEVRDVHGHYFEKIDRAAFNRTLNGAGKNAICVYNHGMTLHGTPDGMASLPLGSPLEIKPDGRGLLTVTRYNKGPWADSVLESIKNGDIKAQSFRGQIFRSSPMGPVPRRRGGEPLTTVTRHELGLADYGPTPTAVNDDAAIVAVRSAADVIDAIGYLDADEREELLRSLGIDDATPGPDEGQDPDAIDDEALEDDEEEDPDGAEAGEGDTTTSDHSEPGTAEDPPAARSDVRHSSRQIEITRRIRVALISRGM
jgi:HK97 family phage prohead protease